MGVQEFVLFLRSKGISTREIEIIEKVAEGIPHRDVADKLFIHEKTVKFHLTKIYRKLGINSKSQLIVLHREFCYKSVDPIPEKTEIEPVPEKKRAPKNAISLNRLPKGRRD